jgi:hypothetical protein
MTDENWQVARLIPTSGISGQEEAEKRATSALLSVMSVVREFGAALVKPLGAPASALETFIEVPFQIDDRRVYPDGLIRAKRGTKTWTALVEVKTNTTNLDRTQLETYLDVARDQGFDALLTISNEIPQAPGVHPTTVDKRRLRKVSLYHYSWAEILTLAVQHRVYRGISDPEQAWILGELIRYLEYPKSGALDFSDMGEAWTTVRDSVQAGTLRSSDKGLPDVLVRWEQLLQFTALRMGRELGADVQVLLSRKEASDPTLRLAGQSAELVERGRLTGSLRVPQAIGDIGVVADLRAGRIHVFVDVDAPAEGRQATKVNWLLRQLKDAPAQLRIDSWSQMSRTSMSELLSTAREQPERLIEDSKKNVRAFRITAASALGSKRGGGQGSFIDSVISAVDGFYEAVVQDLRPWVAKAPQLPQGGRSAAESAGIDTTPPPRDLLEEETATDDVRNDLEADDSAEREEDGEQSDLSTEHASVTDGSVPTPTTDFSEVATDELMTWDSVADRDETQEGADLVAHESDAGVPSSAEVADEPDLSARDVPS